MKSKCRISSRGDYDDCIEASSKLDLIDSMIDCLDGCTALTDDDYNRCIEARDILYEVSKRMADKAKEFIDE